MANYKLPRGENGCCPDYDDRDEGRHHEEDKHEPKVVLNCGTGSGLTLPVGSYDGAGWQPPKLVVGTVTLDTRGIHKPTVKIDFSSLVNFRAESCTGEFFIGIIFQLSKICNNGTKIPLETWVFEKEIDINFYGPQTAASAPPPGPADPVEIDFREPFSFTWCECHDCPGCCTYLVEIIDFETDYIETASITNVGITAMAVG